MDDLLIRMMGLGQQGYSCSQILLLAALEQQGQQNSGLVRAMAGLAYGCGTGRATCGALAGGCCLLAFLAAEEGDPQQPSEHLPAMLQALTDWFAERAGRPQMDLSCEAIVGEAGPSAARQACGRLVADTYAKAVEILANHGIEI